ncbi:MAG: glycosyltransferase, partial [Selenomonadaceae bacterium]|nr:glycosyltransferase [Selenomonadaceae bacterium]
MKHRERNFPMTSIIILSYNTKEYTQMCIQSIRKHTDPGSYEIIVVDNASTDGSLNWLLAQPDIRLIANEENLGFPKGCNQGLEIAEGDDLLLLNSDTIVTPRWLKQLLIALHSSSD